MNKIYTNFRVEEYQLQSALKSADSRWLYPAIGVDTRKDAQLWPNFEKEDQKETVVSYSKALPMTPKLLSLPEWQISK